MDRYSINCDECKERIGWGTMQESACGGTCSSCRAEMAAKASRAQVDAARKERKRQVRQAVKLGTTVSYDLGTLLEDGHSLNTIRKVCRA